MKQVEVTKEGLKIRKGQHGHEALVIDSSRIEDCIAYLHKHNLKNVTVNSFQGYKVKNLDFLARIETFIEEIVIVEDHLDLKLVNNLHNLRSLGIPDNKRDTIDLSNFPKLECLATSFSERLINLEKCKRLRRLTLSNYKSQTRDLSQLPALGQLEDLFLIKPTVETLQGIQKYENLKKVQLFLASKLVSVDAIKHLSGSLREIEIDKCKKIKDYEALKALTGLKKIILSESGAIKSLAFVRSLPKLELLSFWGTNVADGNLAHCEGIAFVGFDDKKHYSHKFKHFQKSNKVQPIVD